MQELISLGRRYERVRPHMKALPTTEPSSLLERFFLLVMRGELTNDQAAVEHLYGPDYGTNHAPYHKLKSKLKHYLPYKLTGLPLLRYRDGPLAITTFFARIYAQHAFRAWRDGMPRAAEHLFLEALALAGPIEQFAVARQSAQALAELYAGPLRDREKGIEMTKKAVWYGECEERLYALVEHDYTIKSGNIRRDRRLTVNSNPLQELYDNVLALQDSRHGIVFSTYIYSVLNNISVAQGDYEQVCIDANIAVSIIDKVDPTRNRLRSAFNNYLFQAKIKLKDYNGALEVLDKSVKFLTSDVRQHYFRNYYRSLTNLLLGNWKQSAIAIRDCALSGLHNQLPEEYRMASRILFAYQSILLNLDKVNAVDLHIRARHFRLGRFLNATRIFERNKQGLNIHILIIELIQLVLLRRLDRFIDRREAIQKYVQRYLQSPPHRRNGLMLTMLVRAVDVNFVADRLLLHCKDDYQELRQLQNEAFYYDPLSTEYISYDILWLLFLEALRRL